MGRKAVQELYLLLAVVFGIALVAIAVIWPHQTRGIAQEAVNLLSRLITTVRNKM